ncbi:FIMAH domain-containing protein [Virgibacillus halotolerans]|uniref:FIMAH domain-containing protein n=1 Tax=Virgibacillus halotolerans TaxID=1071053 RepID=UPI003B849AC2
MRRNYLIYTLNVDDIKTTVEDLEKKGEMTDQEAVRALQMHLTAVGQYEDKGLKEKVVKHMKSFIQLLDHQKENGLISEEAYETLSSDSKSLMKQW